VVLDATPMFRQQTPSERSEFLKTMAKGSPPEVLLARVERRGIDGFPLTDAPREMNVRGTEAGELGVQLANAGLVIKCGLLLVTPSAFIRAKADVLALVERFHDRNRLNAGIGKEELRDQANLGPDVFYSVLDRLAEEKKLVAAADLVHLPGHGVVLKDEEAESKKIIEDVFAAAGLNVPALRDVLAGLKVDKSRAQKIVTLLLREKALIKISEDLVFHRGALQSLREQLAAEKRKSTRIDIARFKDLTGVSRKYAIPLLEYLDREHVTRRVGDIREIL
jgi:selenocysteine-specific elongation factor